MSAMAMCARVDTDDPVRLKDGAQQAPCVSCGAMLWVSPTTLVVPGVLLYCNPCGREAIALLQATRDNPDIRWRTVSDLVPTEDIERIVGAKRDRTLHQARAVSAEQTVYILHSQKCLDSGIDLRECRFSRALDNGIRQREWVEDEPVVVDIRGAFEHTRLVPILGGATGPMNGGTLSEVLDDD